MGKQKVRKTAGASLAAMILVVASYCVTVVAPVGAVFAEVAAALARV